MEDFNTIVDIASQPEAPQVSEKARTTSVCFVFFLWVVECVGANCGFATGVFMLYTKVQRL